MSRCVFGSQRSFEDTGTPLGPMMVRTVAEVAVTSWTDSERRTPLEDEEDEEDDEDETLAADDDEDDDEEEDVELVLPLEEELALEMERGRTMREADNDTVLVPGKPLCCIVCDSEAGVNAFGRGESALVACTGAIEAGADARGSRVGVDDGRISVFAKMTPFSATTSWKADG